MRKLLVTMLAAGIPALFAARLAQARPVPINESARLVAPAPAQALNGAIDGDSILVTARDSENRRDKLLHYRRAGSTWQLQGVLLDVPLNDGIPSVWGLVAARGGVAATLLDGRLIVFERSGATWVRRTVTQPDQPIVGTTLSVDGGRVLVGISHCDRGSAILAKNSAGVYVQTNRLSGDPLSCSSQAHPGGYLSGDYAINTNDRQALTIYRRDGANFEWLRDFTIPHRSAFNGAMDIDGARAVVGGQREQFVFRRGDGGWTQVAAVSSLDRFDGFGSLYTRAVKGDLLLIHDDPWSPLIGSGSPGSSYNVFRSNPDDTYDHVAILRVSGTATLYRPDISGRTVIAQGWTFDGNQDSPSTIFVFDLPATFGATPATVHDDFQGASAATWTALPGSQLAVVTAGHSRVFRQSALTVETGAILDGTDWANQAVQADVKPTQFDGADRGVGVVARWQDSHNFYYASLRNSGQLLLSKRVGGVDTPLGAASLTVVAGKNYLLQLEARGTELIAWVDGTPQVRVQDRSLSHGAAGFIGYRTRVDVDNFVASALSMTFVHASQADGRMTIFGWTRRGSQWQATQSGSTTWFSQPELNIEGQAVIGNATDDEVAITHARIDAFNTSTTASWVGLMSRYVDNRNYYALVLRSNNNVQLRRVVNGTITILSGRAFTVTPGQIYQLRIDAVGDRLRGYVNGVLQVEARDATFTSGRTGLATSKVAASFSGYDAWQP